MTLAMSGSPPDRWLAHRSSWDHWYARMLPTYWVFLFICTHLPPPRPTADTPSDTLMHLAAFAALALLFWRFFDAPHRRQGPHFVWRALLVLGAYAALDELLQGVVGRAPDFADWLANLAGIGLVLSIMEWRRRRSAAAA